ncbi:serine/threonine-protein kinase RIO1-like [Leguminivora glycinivorella]|uniref:serine/threonine-protein kinase RIO1-like n=1 Tax=Leguminivora glycinivorella TaxID=1035111 RepID=UPI00200F88C8|nr:serine/threonine-protein kinase RIO1-like [Leguminivora glycinivorella]
MQNYSNKVYKEEQKYLDEFKPVSDNHSKKKQVTQRMKVKEYDIIEKEKAIARAPSQYKFDSSTTQILETLITLRHAGEFHNIVGKGLNSVVIHAHCHRNYHLYFPEGNAVKVYKLTNGVEKNNAIYRRVEREYEHLEILQTQYFSNNTPHPVYRNKNVIVMSFIGYDQETAPSISTLPPEKLNEAYEKIVKEIDAWYNKLGLIHGSLSATKIVGNKYFIGWSHSVRKDHPMAFRKLMKDCQFVSEFFKSRGVLVKSPEELFKFITGREKINSKVLEVVQKDLWKTSQTSNHSNPNRKSTSHTKTTQNRFKR